MTWLWVAGFGVVGVLARYGFARYVNASIVHPFPIATFLINIVGSFCIGFIAGLGTEMMPQWLRAGLMIGLLGGFTTFSSYCLETQQLFSLNHMKVAIAYIVSSQVVGLVAVYGGVALGHYFRPV